MSAHHSLDPESQRIVDALCNDGCKAVSRYIKDMESGNYPTEMHALSDSQKLIILGELKSIMAVYDRCGS